MSWTATIVKHNDDDITMDVEYRREGYAAVIVGVMLPPQGADLAEHLAAFAPTAAWDWEDAKRAPRRRPQVGMTVRAPLPTTGVAQAQQAPAQVAAMKLEPL